MTEATPGALGRMTLHDDPTAVARALYDWCSGDTGEAETIASWFEQMAGALADLAHSRR